MIQDVNQDILISRVKAKMGELGLNQASLAKAASITPAALSQILKRDRVPSSGVLVKLAGALDESIDYLVGRVDKTDTSIHLQNVDLMELYNDYSKLTKSQKSQVADMISFLKQKNKE